MVDFMENMEKSKKNSTNRLSCESFSYILFTINGYLDRNVLQILNAKQTTMTDSCIIHMYIKKESGNMKRAKTTSTVRAYELSKKKYTFLIDSTEFIVLIYG